MGFLSIIHEVPKQTCSIVASNDCKAQPELEKNCKSKCFACGDSVCSDSGCSKRRKYLNYGRKRICLDCAIDHELENG